MKKNTMRLFSYAKTLTTLTIVISATIFTTEKLFARSYLENAASFYLGVEPESPKKKHSVPPEWQKFLLTQLAVSPTKCFEYNPDTGKRGRLWNINFKKFITKSDLKEMYFGYETTFYFKLIYGSLANSDELTIKLNTNDAYSSFKQEDNNNDHKVYPLPTAQQPYKYTFITVKVNLYNQESRNIESINITCLPESKLTNNNNFSTPENDPGIPSIENLPRPSALK